MKRLLLIAVMIIVALTVVGAWWVATRNSSSMAGLAVFFLAGCGLVSILLLIGAAQVVEAIRRGDFRGNFSRRP
jgi:F0F1-type ATP synthase assembly protein I